MLLFNNRLVQDIVLNLRVEGAEDEHGNPTWTTLPTAVQGFASELVTGEAQEGAVLEGSMRLYLAADSPITGWDSCTFDGYDWEVIGLPWKVFNPRTAEVHHVEADIRRGNTNG